MSNLPSMPLYVDDYEAATAHLTFEEDGAYNRLLRLCWRMSDCSLPDDDEWIMRRLRADKKTMKRIILPIISEFFTRENGRIFQKNQQKIHAEVTERVNKKKVSGSLGGKAKSLNNKDNLSSNTTVLLQAKEPVCSSNQNQSQNQSQIESASAASTDAPPEEKSDFKVLGELACKAAGIDPGKVAVDFQAPIGWIAAGFDPDLDVLPAIQSTAARPGYRPPKSLKYFTNRIREFHDQRRAGSLSAEQKTVMQAKAAEPIERPDDPLLAAILDRVGAAIYRAWFAGARSVGSPGEVAKLMLSTRFKVDRVKADYDGFVRRAAEAAGFSGVDVVCEGGAA